MKKTGKFVGFLETQKKVGVEKNRFAKNSSFSISVHSNLVANFSKCYLTILGLVVCIKSEGHFYGDFEVLPYFLDRRNREKL